AATGLAPQPVTASGKSQKSGARPDQRDRGWYDASAWRQHSDYGRGPVDQSASSERLVQPLSRRQTIATFEMGRSNPCIEQPCRRHRKRAIWGTTKKGPGAAGGGAGGGRKDWGTGASAGVIS